MSDTEAVNEVMKIMISYNISGNSHGKIQYQKDIEPVHNS